MTSNKKSEMTKERGFPLRDKPQAFDSPETISLFHHVSSPYINTYIGTR